MLLMIIICDYLLNLNIKLRKIWVLSLAIKSKNSTNINCINYVEVCCHKSSGI